MTESRDVSQPSTPSTPLIAKRKPETDGHPDADPPFSRHVELRTVVFPRLRVLFLPIPKAGCTSILWRLAELDGVPLEPFARSTLAEVIPALTIHDMSLWPPGKRLIDYEDEERDRVLSEDGWFRFSVVRDPGTRLWSAWQSKLLLREPRFAAEFGESPWFPRIPERPADLVTDFRRFAVSLADGEIGDVHWAVQHDLAAQLSLTHVGRVERLDETLDLLSAHLQRDLRPAGGVRENRSSVPMPPTAYDEAAADAVNKCYSADFEHYEYEPVKPADDGASEAEWRDRVEPMLPMLRETIDRHARIGQLHRVALRVPWLVQRLAAAEVRQADLSKPKLTNLEGHEDFDAVWRWSEGRTEPGFTAVVRARNEARSLPLVLPHLLRAVKRVVLVDNGSIDGTADVARQVASEADALDRLEIHTYPFAIARCGEDHLETPAASVHSLAYFYNWSFSHVRTDYALKWDADMVLTDAAVNVLRDLAWQLEASPGVVKIPRYPLYVVDDRRAFLDLGLRNREPWAWPNRPGYGFVKAMEWEQPLWPAELPAIFLPEWSCIELKHLDTDEFAHWSTTDFTATARTRRKRREWEVFRTLADGGEPPTDVIAIEAPDNRHIVDYVRATWLPARASENGKAGSTSSDDGAER
jgi:hypothetical protein